MQVTALRIPGPLHDPEEKWWIPVSGNVAVREINLSISRTGAAEVAFPNVRQTRLQRSETGLLCLQRILSTGNTSCRPLALS